MEAEVIVNKTIKITHWNAMKTWIKHMLMGLIYTWNKKYIEMIYWNWVWVRKGSRVVTNFH